MRGEAERLQVRGAKRRPLVKRVSRGNVRRRPYARPTLRNRSRAGPDSARWVTRSRSVSNAAHAAAVGRVLKGTRRIPNSHPAVGGRNAAGNVGRPVGHVNGLRIEVKVGDRSWIDVGLRSHSELSGGSPCTYGKTDFFMVPLLALLCSFQTPGAIAGCNSCACPCSGRNARARVANEAGYGHVLVAGWQL